MWFVWKRKVFKVLVGKPVGNRPLGRPRHGWKDGVRMDLLGGWLWRRCVDLIHSAEDRYRLQAVVNTAMNLRVLSPWI
jgi:hypothetical protein